MAESLSRATRSASSLPRPMSTGQYGVDGLYVGVPTVIGANGVEESIEIDLDDEAKQNFQVSVDAVKELLVACKADRRRAGVSSLMPWRSHRSHYCASFAPCRCARYCGHLQDSASSDRTGDRRGDAQVARLAPDASRAHRHSSTADHSIDPLRRPDLAVGDQAIDLRFVRPLRCAKMKFRRLACQLPEQIRHRA